MLRIFISLLVLVILGVIILIAAKPVIAPLQTYQLPQLANTNQISLIATGDVMLGRDVMTKSLDKNDPIYPFRNVAEVLNTADIALINLENPIVEDCPLRHENVFKFCTDPVFIEGLTLSGIDVVNLANNHTLNYGKEGLNQTKNYLEKTGILVTGVGNMAIKEIKGTKFGFVGFDKSQLGNPKLTQTETDLVKKADAESDVLVVSIHWGVEYQSKALPGQHSLARELVGLGADVIVGHHPHWVQNNELINEKPVYYSLGNFIFDQMWSEETKKGLAVKFLFEGKELKDREELLIYMREWAQPEWVK